jgi:hypothetical protein
MIENSNPMSYMEQELLEIVKGSEENDGNYPFQSRLACFRFLLQS